MAMYSTYIILQIFGALGAIISGACLAIMLYLQVTKKPRLYSRKNRNRFFR
jgi:exosome complex RNA-binding protein Rrp42 (RNase PH superfamily)